MNAPAVVFVHYKMPLPRLVAHLEWNREAYDFIGARIFVVVDPAATVIDLPPGVEVLAYPRPMEIFSLTCTANFGIRTAIDAGCDPIIKTDADMVWPIDALRECAASGEGEAVGPPYQMVDSFEARHSWKNRLPADLAIGTISMRASGWLRVCGYDERLRGYGCDDGDIWARIGKAGIARNRGMGIYHIAHQAGAVQQEQHTVGDKSAGVRSDHWGRGEGQNPLRLRENGALLRKSLPWSFAEWGRPCRP